MLKVTNTLGWQKQEFKPIKANEILFYHCGPTVYWNQHIGNMRAVVLADFIRRTLIYLGYDVKFARNYTDFGHLTSDADEGEDKMEKAAKRENLSPKIIADKYIKQFELDLTRLNVLPATIKARATDFLPEMINMIQILLAKKYAYATPKAIYYDISKFPHYFDLSGHDPDKDKVGAGHGTVKDEEKHNSADFALWFFKTGDHKNALQFWPSPFESSEVQNGEGFPGWHIECSAMSKTTLGETIDIHMGGIEHIPVHHPNEIAQSEAISGKKFVNYWLHNEHLNIDGKKMSKSDGNFYLLDNIIEKGFDPMHLRYFFLQSHYRSKQNFTWEALEAAKVAYQKLVNIYLDLDSQDKTSGQIISEYENQFLAALEDDFNLPQALAITWMLVKSDNPKANIKATLDKFEQVLGLRISEHSHNQKQTLAKLQHDPSIEKLLTERNQARLNKDWQTADKIRNLLKEQYNYEPTDKAN